MRRSEREKGKGFALGVLRDSEYATLATVNSDGTPYCIPISQVLINETIYFHCATEGQKLDNIKQKDTVCISCVSYTKLIPENFSTQYESAVVTGKCEIVTDDSEKIKALMAICEKYAKSNMSNAEAAISKSLHRTCVCKITISRISGKTNAK